MTEHGKRKRIVNREYMYLLKHIDGTKSAYEGFLDEDWVDPRMRERLLGKIEALGEVQEIIIGVYLDACHDDRFTI